MTKAQRYFMEIKDKRVAFIGTGVSHLELIKLFLSKGIRCVVCDKKTEDEFDELIYEELSAKGCEYSLGEHYHKGKKSRRCHYIRNGNFL